MADPERKQVPEIFGVKRGADFFRGLTVEIGGQKSASRRRVEYGEMPLDLYVIKLRQASFLSLPFLGREESDKSADLWEPRVDPSDGSVITWRWESQKADKHDFSDCVAFAGRKINAKFNYSKLPPGWSVSMLIPQRVQEGIEAAMRQQDELAHDYGKDVGPEKARVDETFDLLYETSAVFAMGEVTNQDDLKDLAKLAESHFIVHGLLDSKDPIWQRVVTYTLKSTDRDSLNRINPLISRVRARAAFLAGTEREMIARSAGGKAEKVYNHLAIIRAGIRSKIRMAIDTLDDLCAFSGGKVAEDPVMREGSQTCSAREGWELEQYLITISEDVLRGIQTSPYLVPATVARVILLGEACFKNREERIAGRNMLRGTDNYTFLSDSAARMLKNRNPLAARQRISKAFLVLKGILDDPRTTDTMVFDK